MVTEIAPALVTGVCTVSASALALAGAAVLRTIDVRAQTRQSWRIERLRAAADFVGAVHHHQALVHDLAVLLDSAAERFLGTEGRLEMDRVYGEYGLRNEDSDEVKSMRREIESTAADVVAHAGRVELLFPRQVVDLGLECQTSLQRFRRGDERSQAVTISARRFSDAVKTLLEVPQECQFSSRGSKSRTAYRTDCGVRLADLAPHSEGD